ncbi:glutathione ABC transporter substrate-binding protein [Microvirga sp. W0021]|uniref:Glutathione-binding protein GsiB n=1 Tax=Hohaiivirga grylli TaxID=3133970 RepID=A0ABV0BK95_9HYPH
MLKNIKYGLAAGAVSVVMALPGLAFAKTLTVAVQENIVGLDPADVNETLSHSAARTIYQGLFGLDGQMKIYPILAEKFEVNDASTEYTFYLRKGVKFHDGTDFNAEAAKINIERVANPENRLKRNSLVSMVNKVEIIDTYTIKLVLKEPFGALVNNLAHAGAVMISPAALKQYGKEISRHPVGTGPFKFKNWNGDVMEVVKNENYWKPGLPKVDGVIFRTVPESGARLAMLKTGEAQVVVPLPTEMVRQIENDKTLSVINEPSIVEWFASMNTKKKPFDNVKVRQALNYAVNKEAFCKVVFNGFCTPSDSVLPSIMQYHVKQEVYTYDAKKAKELLAEAGYPDGFDAEIVAGNNTAAGRAIQFLQQQFAQVGVKLKVQQLESGVLSSKVWSAQTPEEATVQMMYGGWSASTGDTDWALRPLFWGKGFPPKLFNAAYYMNPKVDEALEAAVGTADNNKRAELYAIVQKEIQQDAPWIFLGVDRNLAGKAKNLEGFVLMADRGFQLDEVEFK